MTTATSTYRPHHHGVGHMHASVAPQSHKPVPQVGSQLSQISNLWNQYHLDAKNHGSPTLSDKQRDELSRVSRELQSVLSGSAPHNPGTTKAPKSKMSKKNKGRNVSLAEQATFDLTQKAKSFDGDITVLQGNRDTFDHRERYPLESEFKDLSTAGGIVSNMLSPIPHTAEEKPRSYLVDHAARAWIHPDEAAYFERLTEDAKSRNQSYILPKYHFVDAANGIVTRLGPDHWSEWALGDGVISTKGAFVPATEKGDPWVIETEYSDDNIGLWRPPFEIKPIVQTASRARPPPTFSSINHDAPSVATAAPVPSAQAQSEVPPPPPPPPPPADTESNTGSLEINGTEYSISRIHGTKWRLSDESKVPFNFGIHTPPDSDAESEAGGDEDKMEGRSEDDMSAIGIVQMVQNQQKQLTSLEDAISNLTEALRSNGKLWGNTGAPTQPSIASTRA